MPTVKIFLCKSENEIFTEKNNWHAREGCTCAAELYATVDVGKVLAWANGKEWGEIHHPDLGEVMTYWMPVGPCRDTWTAPIIVKNGEVITYHYDHVKGQWGFGDEVGAETLGLYKGIDLYHLD